jgi:hypothetical protein
MITRVAGATAAEKPHRAAWMGYKAAMIVLGIETSCDETAAAVVEAESAPVGRLRANVVRAQLAEHARFGGVVSSLSPAAPGLAVSHPGSNSDTGRAFICRRCLD